MNFKRVLHIPENSGFSLMTHIVKNWRWKCM